MWRNKSKPIVAVPENLPEEIAHDLRRLSSNEFAQKYFDRRTFGRAAFIGSFEVAYPRLDLSDEAVQAILEKVVEYEAIEDDFTIPTQADFDALANKIEEALARISTDHSSLPD